MNHPIYSFGYTGRKLRDIVEAVSASEAILVDIRFSPRSRAPMWNRRSLETALGGRYVWAGDSLGNRLYHTNAIEIVDLEGGAQMLSALASRTPVAIMCVCTRPAGCHRAVITEALRARGFTTIEGLPS